MEGEAKLKGILFFVCPFGSSISDWAHAEITTPIWYGLTRGKTHFGCYAVRVAPARPATAAAACRLASARRRAPPLPYGWTSSWPTCDVFAWPPQHVRVVCSTVRGRRRCVLRRQHAAPRPPDARIGERSRKPPNQGARTTRWSYIVVTSLHQEIFVKVSKLCSWFYSVVAKNIG
jgi:hypothetical protein